MCARRCFRGHRFVKLITDNWVLDSTDGIGYHVAIDRRGQIIGYTPVFRLHINREVGAVSFRKEGPVPVKILVEAKAFAERYMNLCRE